MKAESPDSPTVRSLSGRGRCHRARAACLPIHSKGEQGQRPIEMVGAGCFVIARVAAPAFRARRSWHCVGSRLACLQPRRGTARCGRSTVRRRPQQEQGIAPPDEGYGSRRSSKARFARQTSIAATSWTSRQNGWDHHAVVIISQSCRRHRDNYPQQAFLILHLYGARLRVSVDAAICAPSRRCRGSYSSSVSGNGLTEWAKPC